MLPEGFVALPTHIDGHRIYQDPRGHLDTANRFLIEYNGSLFPFMLCWQDVPVDGSYVEFLAQKAREALEEAKVQA